MSLDSTRPQVTLYTASGIAISVNSGLVDSSTLRAVLGSNVGLPSGTNALGSITVNNGTLTSAVNIQDGGNSITIDATTLPLPTGAATETSLAGVLTSVQIMDDWDESDRVKVNPIVGQAGVSAAAGTIDATTQRITIATNDSVSSGIDVIRQWDENDRARVNLISGQVGITAGAGSVSTNTPRVTLASDDPAVASLSVLDDWDNAASDGCSVAGDVAHDSPDAGEPVKIGYKAIAHGTNPTAVTANDRTNAYANRHGIPWFIGGHPNVITSGINYTTAQTNSGIVTVGTGNKIILTSLSVFCDNANAVDVGVTVGFGTSTITNVIGRHPGIAPGSGFVLGNGGGIIGMGGDDEDLRFTCEVPTSGSINVNWCYYSVES